MNGKSDLPSLILIGGQGRSGTTMLQELCNRHPQIVVTHEFKAFVKIGKSFPEYYRALRKPSHPIGIFNQNRLANVYYFWRFVSQIFWKSYPNVGMTDVLMTYQSLFPNVSLIGDKYPNYLWQLPELTSYQGLRIVIIYRDGRDVAQSIYSRVLTDWRDKKWAQKKYSSFTKIALRWTRAIEKMEEHADRVHIIRYEDLVTLPEKELKRLSDYLKVDPEGFKPEMISSTSIGKYKNLLTKEQISEFVASAGRTLERLGYLDID